MTKFVNIAGGHTFFMFEVMEYDIINKREKEEEQRCLFHLK